MKVKIEMQQMKYSGERSFTEDISRSDTLKCKKPNNIEWENPVVKIIFKNELHARKYKEKVEKFFNNLLDDSEDLDTNSADHKKQNKFNHEEPPCNNLPGRRTQNADFVPLYSSSFDDILDCPDSENEDAPDEDKIQDMTCFNCLGNHHLKDCPIKIDPQKVAANRSHLMTSVNSSRYHLEEMRNSLKPGCISNKLKQALGLKDDQLPHYIYNMRVIGYPPGWMLDAEVETSGLAMYDSEGNAIPAHDSYTGPQSKYDSSKFVDYPGFNSPVPKGFKDEWKKLGLTPLKSEQQLTELIKSNDSVKVNLTPSNHTPTLNQTSPLNQTPPLNNNTQKRKLILPAPSNSDSKKNKSDSISHDSKSDIQTWSSNASSTPEPQTSTPKMQNDSSLNEKSFGTSMSMSPGTPIMPHGNPISRLPAFQNFAKDITEHLPFENLPDYVGKFEKMREILSNVQHKIKSLKKTS